MILATKSGFVKSAFVLCQRDRGGPFVLHQQAHRLRSDALLAPRLPDELRQCPSLRLPNELGDSPALNIIRRKNRERSCLRVIFTLKFLAREQAPVAGIHFYLNVPVGGTNRAAKKQDITWVVPIRNGVQLVTSRIDPANCFEGRDRRKLRNSLAAHNEDIAVRPVICNLNPI